MTEARILRAGREPETAVREAAAVLSDGGVLAHPTETVYGLGGIAPALDAEIARLKGREEPRPLLRLAADRGTFRDRHPGLVWGETAERLADAFWPGPLTLVLDDGDGQGLGVRVEGHPLTRRVLELTGATMSSTSLNVSGEKPARSSEEARTVLEAMPEARTPLAWLDGGDLPGGRPSTILSLRGGGPRLLRRGAVETERLEEILEREVADG